MRRILMNVYTRLGLSPIINASGTKTRLGGPGVLPEVTSAMDEAAEASVRIEDLQAAACSVIARRCNAEGGFVTSGASAGLTLAAAACMAGLDVAKMDRLPNTRSIPIPNEIIIPRFQRNAYDKALLLAGAVLVEAGVSDRYVGVGVRETETWELEAAITERTAAVAYVAASNPHPPLGEVTEMAHSHGIPVIVDAAGQLPPASNLSRFTEEGADLVVFSGGKALRGPQGTGFIAGRKDLISSIALQSLDMDVSAALWDPPSSLVPGSMESHPRHGIGRGFKVSKEQIVGLMTALELYTDERCRKDHERWLGILRMIEGQLTDIADTATALRMPRAPLGVPILDVDLANHPSDPYQVLRALQSGRPPVYLGEDRARERVISINPMALDEEAARTVASRLSSVLSDAGE